MARDVINLRALLDAVLRLVAYPKRTAAIAQLTADMQQLEIGILTGQVRGEELKRRTKELAERYEALKLNN